MPKYTVMLTKTHTTTYDPVEIEAATKEDAIDEAKGLADLGELTVEEDGEHGAYTGEATLIA
jgi:hypothetical protein